MPCLLCRVHRELCSALRPVVHKSRAHVTVTTKFCTLTHIISGSSVGNLFRIIHVTFSAPRILTWLSDFWKFCAPLTRIRRTVSHAIRFWRTGTQWHDITARRCGAPPDFHTAIRDVIDWKFPRKRIAISLPWLYTPLDFVFCGYIRDAVYIPLLPTNSPELGGKTSCCGYLQISVLNFITDMRTGQLRLRCSCNLPK